MEKVIPLSNDVKNVISAITDVSDFIVIVKTDNEVTTFRSDSLTYYNAVAMNEIARDSIHRGGMWEDNV